MSKLNLFLVGGFLGSGKTTAIYQAAKIIQANGEKIGVITNDQGTQQVDTQFFQSQDIASEEVADGCFCCNYADLEDRIQSLQLNEHPNTIFAESVGSCTDLAATVINPLLKFNPDQYHVVLSVFADIRLLVQFLQGNKSLFYDNVNYIYEKQLEEADIIVVNKIDLLTEHQLKLAKELINAEFGNKTILYQNSLSPDSITNWLDVITNQFSNAALRTTLEIDYDIYGAGEAELAWLDEEVGIVANDNNAVAIGYLFMRKLYNKILTQNYPIGHLKFLMDNGVNQHKVSFTSVAVNNLVIEPPVFDETDRMVILINARIQTTPETLKSIVDAAIIETESETNCKIIAYKLASFKPGYPKPTHRLVEV